MSLKLYYDFLSQPSRALYIFLKKCDIPFESKLVNLSKFEQLKPEFEKINPWKKVPCIEHKGFLLSESIGILRYLSREFKIDDHWYPRDSRMQAKVDEYLEWQHLNTRLHCTTYFRVKYLIPLRTKKPANPHKVRDLEASMIECLDQIENVWLKDNSFLTNNEISIADIVAACEIEQPRLADYDPREGRPNVTAPGSNEYQTNYLLITMKHTLKSTKFQINTDNLEAHFLYTQQKRIIPRCNK